MGYALIVEPDRIRAANYRSIVEAQHSSAETLRLADDRLYEAKRAGRNQVL